VADFVDEGTHSTGSSSSLGADDSRVVTARGTEDGLVLRIDGKAEWAEILTEIESFLGGRKRFFEGGQISIEWLERLPTKEQSSSLEDLLRDEYGIVIATRKKRPVRGFGRREALEAAALAQETLESGNLGAGNLESGAEDDGRLGESGLTAGDAAAGVTIPLFNEVLPSADLSGSGYSEEDSLKQQVEQFTSATLGEYYTPEGEPLAMRSREGAEDLRKKYISRVSRLLGDEILGDDVLYDDDANAKVVYGTLRSGQKVETPYSLLVIGDVNPGADLTAGGDIIVLGSLRGTAHASAYDDDSFDKVIIAMQMRPMQLRIGSVISRGSEDVVSGVEIARIDNRRIIVESFSPKKLFSKKLR